MTDPELVARVEELEQALHRQREIAALALRRCELLEAAAKRAYGFAAGARPPREDVAKEGE